MDDILKIADDPSLLIDELPNLNEKKEEKSIIESVNIELSDLKTDESLNEETNIIIEEKLENDNNEIIEEDKLVEEINDNEIIEDTILEEADENLNSKEVKEETIDDMIEEISSEEISDNEFIEDIDIIEPEVEIIEDVISNKTEEDNIEEIKEEINFEEKTNIIEETDTKKVKKKGVLDKYGENLTNKEYVTNPAIARDLEIEKTILTLLTPDKSAILVGKAGIGKTAIVEGIGYLIQNDKVPKAIRGYEIIKVNTSSLTGKYTTEDGTEELRINILLNELQNAEDTILFIDEIHTLVIESRNSGIDFLNAMKPALSRGDIKVIGATTLDEYNQYLIKDKAFLRRFEKIEVEEPNAETTVKILMGSYPRIEKKTGVKFGYPEYIIESIMSFIVDMTSEYKRIYELGSRYPDNAIALLSKAFSYAKFDDSEFVKFKHIYKAIMNCQSVYSDVIKKESEVFKEKFKDHLERENVDLNDY